MVAEQSVVPMIAYRDPAEAIDWLVSAFGFRELRRITDDDGRISHAELDVDGRGGMVMIAAPSPDYEGPRQHAGHCEAARSWLSVPWVVDGVLVHVDHLDAHLARAKGAGANLLTDLEEDEPGRRYRVEDVEGHRWMFMERA